MAGTVLAGFKKYLKPDEINNERTLRDLTEDEYLKIFHRVKQRVEKFPQNERENLKIRLEKGYLNKYNIHIYDKVTSDKNLYKNANIWHYCDMITNEPKAIVAEFIINNLEKIKKNRDINLNSSNIISSTESCVQAETKINLMIDVLENNSYEDCNCLDEILIYSKNKKEALNIYNFNKIYGISPKDYEKWIKIYGKEITLNMLNGLKMLKNDLDINFSKLSRITYFREEPFFIFNAYDYKGNIIIRFDKNNGSLLSISNEDACINFQDKKITLLNSKKIKNCKDAMPNERQKLISGSIVSKTLENDLIENFLFKNYKSSGAFKLYERDKNKKEYQTGIIEFDKKGGFHIESKVKSNSGYIVDSVYADDKKGNSYYCYMTSDSKGNIISKTKKTFKRLSENHHISSCNGQYYDTYFTENEVIITKLDSNKKKTKDVIKYSLLDITDETRTKIENFEILLTKQDLEDIRNNKKNQGEMLMKEGLLFPYSVDKSLLPALKNLSGDEWFNLYNANVYGVYGYNQTGELGQSWKGFIRIGKNLKLSSMLDTLLHEIGHEKFVICKLYEDEILKNIYTKEKKQVLTTLPDLVINQFEYFLQKYENAIDEIAAESNVLNNKPDMTEETYSRTLFMRKYFPETIAYIQKVFNINNF